MKIELSSNLKALYPKAVLGSLVVKGVYNKKSEVLEQRKRDLEIKIRENHIDPQKDEIIESYNAYFKKWDKKYPIVFQIETIKQGNNLPNISLLVDSMFLAELKNRILTSGHDLDTLQDNLMFDISEGNEQYLKLNNDSQKIKKDDVILKDKKGILASILYGPAKRTSIALDTKNATYLAWCPYGMSKDLIRAHLNDIFSNLCLGFKSPVAETKIYT